MSSLSLPPDEGSMSSLPLELHAVTREEHTSLNRQILARLPLCLPPNANEPLLYAFGMIIFSQIYTSFEQAWDGRIEKSPNTDRIHKLYSKLLTQHLPRSTRLHADLDELKRRLGKHAARQLDQMQHESSQFATAISLSITSKPHVLLAYAWSMYLALFNGGRWIRKQLHTAGEEFWLGSPPPLSFWDFEGSADDEGEEIKKAFKQNFLDASGLLTPLEHKEVVVESKKLFAMCLEMVRILDQIVAQAEVEVQPGRSWVGVVYFALLWYLMSAWEFVLRTCISWKRTAFLALRPRNVHTD